MPCIAESARTAGTTVYVGLETVPGQLPSPADAQQVEIAVGAAPSPNVEAQWGTSANRAGDGRARGLIAGQYMVTCDFNGEWKLHEQEFLHACAFGGDTNEVGPTVFAAASTVAATNRITVASGGEVFLPGSLVLVNGLVAASTENHTFALVVDSTSTTIDLDPAYVTLADEGPISITVWRPPSHYPGVCPHPISVESATNTRSQLFLGGRLTNWAITGEAEGTTAITVSMSGMAQDEEDTDTPATAPRYFDGTITPPVAEAPYSIQRTSAGTAGTYPGVVSLIIGGVPYTLGAAGLHLRSLNFSHDLSVAPRIGTNDDGRVLGHVTQDRGGGMTWSLPCLDTPALDPLLALLRTFDRTDLTMVFCNGTSLAAIRLPDTAITTGIPNPDDPHMSAAIGGLAADTPESGYLPVEVYDAHDVFNAI